MRAELRILLALAGLFGACGTAAAAASSHMADMRNLGIAADFLLVHAAALVGLAALLQQLPLPARLLRLGTWLVAGGVMLFCGDLTLRDLLQFRLFPMAAPLGGMLMIGGWSMIALGALTQRN